MQAKNQTWDAPNATTIKPFGDTFIPIILGASREHTPQNPFCWDSKCPCHQDRDAICEVRWTLHQGLCTNDEAVRIIEGRQI